MEQEEEEGEGGAFLLGEECGEEPGGGAPVAVEGPFAEGEKAEECHEEGGARENIDDSFCLHGMEGEERGGDPCGGRGDEAAESYGDEQYTGEMEEEIDEVIAGGMGSADLVIGPESEPREGAGLGDGPGVEPATGRGDGGVIEEREIVEIEGRGKGSGEGEKGGGENEERSAHCAILRACERSGPLR